MVLEPTHQCFDDALDYLEHVATTLSWVLARQHILAHGICIMPEDSAHPGEPYAHAWVEHLSRVIQAGLVKGERVYFCTSEEDFETVFQPHDVTRYTLEEAAKENARTGHYGPWMSKYKELTREQKRRTG